MFTLIAVNISYGAGHIYLGSLASFNKHLAISKICAKLFQSRVFDEANKVTSFGG